MKNVDNIVKCNDCYSLNIFYNFVLIVTHSDTQFAKLDGKFN